MSIISIIDWATKRIDQVFKWHGGYSRRENVKKVNIAVDKRNVDAVHDFLRIIKKQEETRKNSS
uniref:Uncharacterized protein n=1 Tax=viral metagenome TaxID=1070528 RepID=A0A6M3LL10_9ZZZZ